MIALAMGADFQTVLGLLQGSGALSPSSSSASSEPSPEEDRLVEFVSVVLADTEETWGRLFEAERQSYAEPTLVVFRDAVQSACGQQSSAVGPFYCPGDQQVYLDLGFFNALSSQLGAPGDFAQAYVIAHEVGHHVQHLLGTSTRVHQLRQRASEAEANALSVRLELQADCYAGIWAHFADRQRGFLEPGDIEEGLRAASSIGDDTLQRNAGRNVAPDSFTHGTSEQRVRWFTKGYEAGTLEACDTFADDAI